MKGETLIRTGAAALAAAILLGGTAAQAAPWKMESTNDGTRYRIGNPIRNSFVIHCGKNKVAGTWIDMTVLGERLPKSETISIEVGPERIELKVDESGRITTATKDSAHAFSRVWNALRGGEMMTVNYPNGLAGSFTLRGTTQAMPAKACATDYDRG